MLVALERLVPSALKVRVRRYFMRGGTVHCPLCDQGAIAFLPAGTPPRAHALCPFCGSLERGRMMWLFLQREGLLPPGTRVLHIAPEKGLARRIASTPGIRYTAGDKHEPGYRYPAGTIDLDITAMPFADGSFDLVICSHVLEHVPDDRAALRELKRVLAPEGVGLVLVPQDMGRAVTFEDPTVTDPQDRLRLFGQFDHVRIYGRDLVERLREAGLRVEERYPGRELGTEERFRAGIRADEPIHLVRP
jgi:SAM-dependent methyltransferase